MTGTFKGLGLVVLAVGAGSLNATVIGASRADFRASYALSPHGRVAIHNLYGDVQITAWDRDEVLVEATKHSADQAHLNDAQIVVDSSSGLVSIRTQYTGGDAGQPASVENPIQVPPSAQPENRELVNGGGSLGGEGRA